jgi:hypothetical protein
MLCRLGGVRGPVPQPGREDHRRDDAVDAVARNAFKPLHPGVPVPGALLGVPVGGPDRVIDIDERAPRASSDDRNVSGQAGQEPGRDRVQLPDTPNRSDRKNVPNVDGARTPVNNRPIPPCRNTAISEIESPPVTMPATSADTFNPAASHCSSRSR